MVGGNGENQFRQYARQIVGNLHGYNAVQNVVQNLRVQNIVNQNGLIGVLGNANQNLNGNGNLVAARAKGNAGGHNGNQIRCYNFRGVGQFARNYTARPRRRDAAYLQTQLLIAQKEEEGIQLQAEEFDLMVAATDLDEIEEVNANSILMANLQQASTSGTQTDKAPIYDSDGSVEVHDYENCDDNEIFIMFTQEEQYTKLLEPIPEPHQVPQNDNNVISEVTSVEQSGKTVEQHPANFEETQTLQLAQESREKMKQLNKEIKPANYTKINHLSGVFVSQTAKSREELYFSNDSKMANVSKSISLPNEDFSDDTTPNVARKFLNEVKNTIVTLQRVVKHRMTLETQNWSSSAHQELHKIIKDENFPIVNQVDDRVQNFEIQFLKEAAKFVRDFKSLAKEADDSLAKYKALELEIRRLLRAVKLENENVELEFQVLNYAKENAHLKTTYKNLFDSISMSRTQTKTLIASLQHELQNTIYENAKLRAQLFKKVSVQKDNTCGRSKNTKFAKQSILGKPPMLGEIHALSKPVTSNSVPTSHESKVMKNDKVIALGMFRINPFKTSREEKHVPNTVRASARIKPITVSQPPVITKKDVNSDSNGLSSIGIDNTKTRRPQPRSKTKNDRVPSASKSSQSKNKGAKVEEHHRNLLLFKNTKHMSSACNNIKLYSQNVISKFFCAMCKQCLISVNHDVCLRNYVNGKNSRGKKQKANVSIKEKQNKHQQKVRKPKKVGFIKRLATPKPSKPRFLLRWSPTGRLFDKKGKIVDSSKSESQSDCFNGDSACTSNTLEPKIKRFPNFTSLLGRRSYFPPTSTIPRRSRKQTTNVVEREIHTIVEMADNLTMAHMLQAPIEGYEDAIVVPQINANNFELKQTHPEVPNTTIKLLLFPFSLEGEARIWLDKEPPRSILTWEDLVSKFINQFFPPSKTTYLQNEITNFLQKPNETFNEARSYFPPTSTIPRRSRKQTTNIVEPEFRTIVEMADNRTMAQMLQAPIEGYEDAIVMPPINANNFKLKQTHPEVPNTTIKLLLFPLSLEGEARIWLDKEPPRSILTNPTKRLMKRGNVLRICSGNVLAMKPNETFNEAWERFKDLLRQCPRHGFSELHQLDTFYNALNTNDQDALDSVAGGNFLDKIPRECLLIIESKSKVRYSRSRITDSRANTNAPLSSSLPSNSFDHQQIVASLEDKLDIYMNRFEKSLNDMKNSFVTSTALIKAVEEVCITCGANHSYNQCPLTRGNDFPVFHDNIQQFQAVTVGNFIQNRNQNVSNQMRPPGLPKFEYHKEHLCPSCEQGKSKRASHPPKPVPNSRQRLHLLHMDLCGPMRITDINGKRYVLVIIKDYSRYTWVHFLRSKDETPEVIKTFLKRIIVLLQSPVIIIRTNNGTKFTNQVLKEYFDCVGISHQMSSVQTPQQNRAVERRNWTLVEAARTMLIFSRAPLFLWAEAMATACFTQNRSIIHRRFTKTPYELINGRKPDISFLHVFCALCYPKNDREDIGKLGAKGDIGFFIGYSADSCAYRIYNRRTKKIMETMNVSFDELSAIAFEQRSSKPGLQCMTSGQISSGLDLTYAPSTITKQQPTEGELDLLFEAMYEDYFGGQPSATVENVPTVQEPQVRQTSTASTTNADNVPIPTNSSSHATNIPITSQDVDELN
nr:retrovirus-related Pol polyprotein from transposon TNT 1-94 [Tanacetum cinerariifolium]